ncbi:hypothetical protein BRD17_06210 [Halobacteriales archaeon SW_7_68_16]|nr:MAG: hypothetical protein BRD17_06210 [Halobacteriales archaeon SW_7_68_16]
MSVREVAVDAYREALPALATSVVAGLFAGVVLGGMRPELRAVPGLLVLVPALLATRGNVYGSLGARLATALHQGLIEPRIDPGDWRLRAAVAAALSSGLVVSAFAAVTAFAVLSTLGSRVAPVGTLVVVAVLSGIMSGLVLVIAVVSVVVVGFRRGRDPDALVGPIVTTTGDLFGLASLLFAVRVVVG